MQCTVLLSLFLSLWSKQIHGVFCSKKPISVFLDAGEMWREQKHRGGGGVGGRGDSFCAHPKLWKSAFFGIEN